MTEAKPKSPAAGEEQKPAAEAKKPAAEAKKPAAKKAAPKKTKTPAKAPAKAPVKTAASKTEPEAKKAAATKPSIEPKSARGTSTTSHKKTAKEAEAALQAKIEKAHAGTIPEVAVATQENPAPFTSANGESAGLAPVQAVRAMPAVGKKKEDKEPTTEKAEKPEAAPEPKANPKPEVKKPEVKKPAEKTTEKTTVKAAAKPAESKAAAPAKKAAPKKKPASKPAAKPSKATSGKSLKPAKADGMEVPVFSMLNTLVNEAPAGVAVELKPDDKPAPGEVKGAPKIEAGSGLVDERVIGCRGLNDDALDPDADSDSEEENYDDFPDPVMQTSETGLEAYDDEEDADEASSGEAVEDVEKVPANQGVVSLSAKDDDENEVELDRDGKPYHETETLGGRRTPVRPKEPPKEEPFDPSRTVNLDDERVDIEHAAQQALCRLQAKAQPTRAELAAKFARESVEALERGNPAFEKDAEKEPESEMARIRRKNNEYWNPVWVNDVKRGDEEQKDLADKMIPPRYPYDDNRPQIVRDVEYAQRMDAWEKKVIERNAARDEKTYCRSPEPGPRDPVPVGTHETLGGFPTPHQTRKWTYVGQEDEPVKPVDKLTLIRRELNALHAKWAHLDAFLRGAVLTAFVAGIGAAAAWTTTQSLVPELTVKSTPVSVTAVVSDDEIRNLMLLTAMLDSRGLTTGRTPPQVDRIYLTGEMRQALGSGSDPERMALPLDDRLLKAAFMEAADMVGAPVLSRKAVLAMPDLPHSTTGRTVDVTALVVERLGLKNVSAAAAKEVIAGLMSPDGTLPEPAAMQKKAKKPVPAGEADKTADAKPAGLAALLPKLP